MSGPRAAHCLHVTVARAAEEQLSAFLDGLGCRAVELRTQADPCVVIAYAEDAAELDSWQARLEDPSVASALELIDVERVALRSDWELTFTQYLQPVELTPRLTVYPHPPERPPGDDELFLKPAVAFGFGEHPTTRLLVRWLETQLLRRSGAKVLDFGCGTGILSLAAGRLGARGVKGIDVDPAAVLAARENARLNGLQRTCAFTCDTLERQDRDFDVIVANIDSRVLLRSASALATRMSGGACLALTGFLEEHCAPLTAAFESSSVPLVAKPGESGWALLATATPEA